MSRQAPEESDKKTGERERFFKTRSQEFFAKLEAIRDKTLGGKKVAQQADEKRGGFREVVSEASMQEVMLK